MVQVQITETVKMDGQRYSVTGHQGLVQQSIIHKNLCMCVCVCVYMCVHVLECVYVYVSVCVCVYVSVCGHVYTCVCVYMCTCVRMCTCACRGRVRDRISGHQLSVYMKKNVKQELL